MAYLQGQVRGIGMERDGDRWEALVNVHDAVSTYQLTLVLERLSRRWIVTKVSAQ